MSWIKENKFIAALGGGTLLAALLLGFVGYQGFKHYEEAKEKFDAAAAEASEFEKLALYPKPANRDGKRKALGEYRQSVEAIQAAFAPYCAKDIKNISPQEFTNRLLAAKTEVRKAFEDGKTTVPEAFFLGFERYKTSLASGNTTGILDYQLASVKKLMLALAAANPTDLKNLYRPNLPEEDGQTYTPAATDVARNFPLEITFVGSEKSARQFFSSINKLENEYVVVRSLRMTNEKKDAPRVSDAKFDTPVSAKPPGAADAFAGGLVLPGEEAPAAKDKPAEAVKTADSSRILYQVLGSEQVQVFARLEILQFLPAKKLP